MKPAKLQFQLGRGSAEIFKISKGVPGKQKVGNHCVRVYYSMGATRGESGRAVASLFGGV